MRVTLLAFAFLYSICFVKAQEKATYHLQGTLAGVPKNQQGKLFLQRFGSDLPLDSARLEQGQETGLQDFHKRSGARRTEHLRHAHSRLDRSRRSHRI